MRMAGKQIRIQISTLVFLCVGLCACGVQIRDASLYDGVEQEKTPEPPAEISLAVEPVIFRESGSNFWVTDDTSCTTGYVTREVAHEGETALRINWDRDPATCEWAGFGIGWDNWVGKDLSEIYDHAAIEMYVRSQEGKMFGLPIVLTLEDYTGNMAWSYTSNSYFERYYIDEEWQRVVVPLNTFDPEEDGLDLTNIKQLQFELQQAGGIFLDDIRLVFYEPSQKDIYEPEDALEKPERSYPVQLFDDAFIDDNGWGMHSDQCQTITIAAENPSTGEHCIHARWNTFKEDCYTVAFGVSWNKWFPENMTAILETGVLEFDVRTPAPADSLPVQVAFEDYNRVNSSIYLRSAYSPSGYGEEWSTIRIPLADFPVSADFSNIKQLVFRMEGEGEAFFDNIRIMTSGS